MLILLLLHGAIVALVTAGILGLIGAQRRSPAQVGAARILAGLAAVLAAAILVRRGMETGHLPVTSRFDTHILAAVLIVSAALALDLVRSLAVLTIGATPVGLILLIFAAAMGPPREAGPEGLANWLTGAHVLATMAAYASFALASVTAMMYLAEQRQLKGVPRPAAMGFLPSLETSYRFTTRGVWLGLALLTLGILLGYQYGRQVHTGSAWRRDPMVLLTTAAWLLYLIVAVASTRPAFKGRRTALAAAACFVLLLAASWMAAFWSQFHRY